VSYFLNCSALYPVLVLPKEPPWRWPRVAEPFEHTGRYALVLLWPSFCLRCDIMGRSPLQGALQNIKKPQFDKYY
jgi:hypothetical protein